MTVGECQELYDELGIESSEHDVTTSKLCREIKRLREEPRFTIEEIKQYLVNSDSYGDAVCFLTPENIEEANNEDAEETF